MITGYHRPESKDQALKLLTRSGVNTIAICGSTRFGASTGDIEVVDMQKMGLTGISQDKDLISIGGLITLDDLSKNPKTPAVITKSLIEEYTVNRRNSTTLAGAIYTSIGNSLLAGTLMAYDARIRTFSEGNPVTVSDWLKQRNTSNISAIIDTVMIPLAVQVEYAVVRKTPLAPAMIGVVLEKRGTERKRIVILGEMVNAPVVIFDGKGNIPVEDVVKNARSHFDKSNNLTSYLSKTLQTLLTRLEEGV